MSDYILKLKSLLHDPIHKIWSFQNVNEKDITHREVLNKNLNWYEKIALDLFKFILEEELTEGIIHTADEISSGLSKIVVIPNIENEEERKNFDEKTSISLEKAIYSDPFKSLQQRVGNPQNHDEVKEIFKKIGNLNFNTQKDKAKFAFLFLWRFLPDIFPWIETHPADSRTPNNSMYDHLVQTSAIATCIQGNDTPAFLLFTITPVQSFISTARKTQDLWAGSFLLSYLIYKAIEKIVEESGPDHIIFPNLRGQPLFDLWLYEKLFKDIFLDIERFKEWQSFIRNKEKEFIDKLTIANFPNRFLAIIPYSKAKEIAEKCKKNIEDTIENLLKEIKDPIIKPYKDLIKNHILSYLKIYWVIVPFYNNSHTNLEPILKDFKNLVGENELFKVIKIINTHPYYKERNVGIAYSLLVELTEKFLASRKMIKDFKVIPPQTGEKCHLCGEYDIVPLDWATLYPSYVKKNERLCGLCLLKRFLPEIIKEKLNLNEQIKFPSTSEMATVTYKKCLDDQLSENFKTLFNQNIPKMFSCVSVPELKNHKLYEIDGEWLMESSYRKNYIKNEFGIDINETKLEEMKTFLKENKINPPIYYAILAMDGDNIGKWLNGEFLPEVKELIHPDVASVLECYGKKDKDIQILLDSKHPMSPSFHNQFSRMLSIFALEKVKQIAENSKYYGKLIYAGGDDVLAFLPVKKALDCAYKLNNAFREILGEKASMSAGIVFVHHKYPLSLALKEVREVEKLAKNKYNRNAFCIKYISGSGERRITGMKWDKKEFIDELVKRYNQERLSAKLAYDFMEIVKELTFKREANKNVNENIHEILINELKRLYRHKLTKEKYDEKFEERLLENLDTFKYNYEAFADMLIIARFISSI